MPISFASKSGALGAGQEGLLVSTMEYKVGEGGSQQLHVFDLPQLYTKPSADVLLRALDLLTSAPPSWDCSDSEDDYDNKKLSNQRQRRPSQKRRTPPPSVSSEGLPRYLTGIIGSDLKWIEDENIKEMIWEQASLRLSERSGRSAMPAMTRKFQISTSVGKVEIALHEPALTADNLGLKTWASSYQLAKRLRHITFPPIQDLWVLELGSGTGLVGIAAAAILGWRVCLTDLPEIVSNLQRNVDANLDAIERNGGQACAATLDWSKPECLAIQDINDVSAKDACVLATSSFPVILVADALYTSDHPRLLVQAIEARLSATLDARVIVELPLREAFGAERDDFRRRMAGIGLRILNQGEETGYDDWGWTGDVSATRDEVRCWWSIWGWNE